MLEDTDNIENPMWVYESYEITAATARMMYPKAELPFNASGRSKVEYTEYWERPHKNSQGKRVIWVAGRVVHDGPNPFRWNPGTTKNEWTGYLPYYIATSGWGTKTSDGNPLKYYVGLLRRQYSVLLEEAKQATAASVQLAYATFPPLVGMGVEQDLLEAFRLGPAARFAIPNPSQHTNLGYLTVPEPPRGVYDLLSIASRYSQDVSKFGALGGGPQPGVGSATESEAVGRNAAAKLNHPLANLQLLAQRVNRDRLMDVENLIGQPVSLLGTEHADSSAPMLRPDEIRGEYANKVKMTTIDQTAVDRVDARFWLDVGQRRPDISPETILSHLVDNPQQEMELAYAGRIFNGQAMEQLITLMSMAAMGEVADLPRQALESQIARDGPATPPGGAGGGGGGGAGDTPAGAPELPTQPGREQQSAARDAAQLNTESAFR